MHAQGLICLAERKASLLWSSEIFNIVISSPNCNYRGERSDGGDLSKLELSSLQLESEMEDKDYKWVTPVGSPRSACGYGHAHQPLSDRRELRSCRDMEELIKKRDDRSPWEKHEGNEHLDVKEVNKYTPNNNEFQLHDDETETVFIQEKDLKPGVENYSARTEPSIRKEQMPNLAVEDQSIHRNTIECSKELSGKYNCNEPCLAVASSYQDPSLYKDLTPTSISSASTSRPTKGVLSMDKGKEQIIYDADDSISSSNRREDGNEKFECISSRAIDSTVKRARIYDSESEKLVGGKRLKRLNNGNCSFMNWVTSITNGLTRPSHYAPMEVFQHPSISDEDREDIGVSHGTRGFRSIFQAMYNPGSNVSDSKTIDAFKGTEGEKAGNLSFPASSFCFLSGVKENFSTRAVNIGAYGIAPREKEVLASSKRFNQDVCQVENSPSAAILDSCAELMTQNRHVFRNSLWITRLSPGVSERIETDKTSSFESRLDVLKHTKPSKIINEDIGANKICLFCGMSEHSIRECSEVDETRLEQYLKSISLYDSIKKSSCFCILCFELDHWAASCLNTSSKRNQVLDGSSASQRENKAAETDFAVCAKVSGNKNESAAYGTIDIRMNQVEDTTNAENMKMATSCSWQNELKRSEFKPFCSQLPTTVMDEPKGIFAAVRKLRLSRMDILRWRKASTPHYNLAGFFLRLRIGNVPKGLEGTGYHVACINGASCQSSISVCVGSSNYSVTIRFISNQDFDEDELKTWWFQKVRDGGKMPSREELNEKLQHRKMCGF